VGAIQHELLKDGARSAIAIDASSAYLHAAKQEADIKGTATGLPTTKVTLLS
jgi:23S rRNA G2069 N7-methylase RlmK/C1962 C5-methylase RlmI